MSPTRTARRRALEFDAELASAIESSTFLAEWLADTNARWQQFKEQTEPLSAAEREQEAAKAGFRSWAGWTAYQRCAHRALELFATDATFRSLWTALRRVDDAGDLLGPVFRRYGPHNGGAPRRILSAIEQWHKAPKFTAAEMQRHHKKIANLTAQLIELVDQVTPSGMTDQYFRFELDDASARALLDSYQTPKAMRFGNQRQNPLGVRWTAKHYLERAGITPLWALSQVAEAARRGAEYSSQVLPRKVRAANAYRTYMIREVAEAIQGDAPRANLPVGDQLLATLVALLVNVDCSIDDVRKGLHAWRTEDLMRVGEEMLHGKSEQ
jgi:hypothetical protein